MLFTSEFLYVMGGPDSKDFLRFQDYCARAFNILRKNAYLIVNLLAMMVSAGPSPPTQKSHSSNPCRTSSTSLTSSPSTSATHRPPKN